MSFQNDELNQRRQNRAARAKKRQRAEKLARIRLIIGGAVLVCCAVGIIAAAALRPKEPEAPQPVTEATVTEAPAEESTCSAWEKAPQTIHIAAAGDLNITDKVIWSGQQGTVFDYTNTFMDVAPVLAGADLAMLNFEGNLIGPPYGSETLSSPVEMVEALKSAGVDLLQMANSCSVYNGMLGLSATLDSMRVAGIEPVGAYASNDQFRRSGGYTICEVNGISVAVVAFTKGVGGLGMPSGSEKCVNLLYDDYYDNYTDVAVTNITSILKNLAAEKPDITIAMLHWGSEYNDGISDTQKKILELMKKNGVDVILGTHPHLVHGIEYDENTGFLCAYSLGDFFGDGKRGGTNYSIILDLEITKDFDTGTTRVTDYKVTPIYILSEEECDGKRRVVRLENAMTAYELNFVDKITEAAYESMGTSLERIKSRIKGEAAATGK